MTTKNTPTTREELDALSKDELVAIAAQRGVAVVREDGADGEPLKSDYVAALASSAPAAPPRERIPAGRFTDAQGHPVNEDGERIDARGTVIEE